MEKSFKQTLLDMKKETEERLQTDEDHDTGELSNYDNHPGDGGSELFEQTRDLALDEQSRDQLYEIDQALAAIEDGSYGTCKECGKDIPEERLEIVPTTLYCVDHAKEMEESRPVEEEVTSPIEEEATSLKQEMRTESWQDVEAHGTSDSEQEQFTKEEEEEDYHDERK
ncbi:TraR/DksA C4-type zinc finger protein [Paenalkalicoccus suaedae]|uniref:TraR/DksA C4-type zinc finger protein n=1 Tax=Paenalkalicoccus suaedae TaxID=2592382 RepID=A0A859FE78_9BACI|nr:TraR/DksA C4-type zinc finger protein [Paenalkalicoccus suaedae]QKS71180.1 TraR/DksA C4-type zinc finger protein [Paenalkalicoccus suaedae]